tara:strand:+ start:61 stop:264 length:204 start_codon:yes stop_codon:yes gene_type:complete
VGQNTSLNNTLEEELRLMLVQKNNECNALRGTIDMLKQNIRDEQEAKYRAYIKIADLQKANTQNTHP